jgi:thioredoxin 1
MTIILIILGVVLLFIVLLVYNYKKMNNMQELKTSNKIKILNNKNFKMQIRKGIVMVDFWASWCAPCKMMTPILNEIAEKESKRVQVAKVNVEYNQQLAKKFKVKNIPTLIIFQNGKEVKRITGFKTKKILMKEIDKLKTI